ncbi:hypothetical protein PG997_011404 [Apiospora hydei]|uniref:Uncharacterized protein n=1 Tax=Apiospora hydei TaxID=1337664 RepID=A0ABR1VIY4_9PEZI
MKSTPPARKETPRFSFEADSGISLFDLPLEYATDAENCGMGRDKYLGRVKDESHAISKEERQKSEKSSFNVWNKTLYLLVVQHDL